MSAVVEDLKWRSCTCRLWQLNGVPCVHVAAVLFLKLNGNYEYVDPYFYAEAYRSTYGHVIVPFLQACYWGRF